MRHLLVTGKKAKFEDKVQGQRCYLQFVDSINLSKRSKVKSTRYFMIYKAKQSGSLSRGWTI